jgi:dipeptidyl aminopeptidase/acylaminoacyl peptidase
VSIKTVLDDAAAEATAGLQIDLRQAQRQAGRRREQRRWRARLTMASGVAVAALIAVIAVLLPGRAILHTEPAPSAPQTPIGVPTRWFYAPPWTPPVTRHPMTAASMVINAGLAAGWSQAHYEGPVLVSADGKSYGSLPWGKWDASLTLSPSGRYVAWVSQKPRTLSVVHRLRLSDGTSRDVKLPWPFKVIQFSWNGDQLSVQGDEGNFNYELNPASDVLHKIPVNTTDVLSTALPDDLQPGDPDTLVGPLGVRGPDGSRMAYVVDTTRTRKSAAAPTKTYALAIGKVTGQGKPDRTIPIITADPVSDVRVLAWAPGGIVVRVQTKDPKYGNTTTSLRLIAGDGSSSRILSRTRGLGNYPIAVAADVVGSGQTVPGVAPHFPPRDRSHLQFLIGRAWELYHLQLWLRIGLGLAVLTAAVGLARRFRRSQSLP